MRRGFSWLEFLVTVGVVGLMVLLAVPFFMRAKSTSCGGRGKCASNLRQLALAASSYASDHRFFPHVGSMRKLDGDWTTPDALRVYTALLHMGYLDSNEVFVCPSSFDLYTPASPAQINDSRRWTFGGPEALYPTPWASPLASSAPLPSPSLVQSQEVSYGWTRKPMNRNAPSSDLLAADRSVRIQPNSLGSQPGTYGNHQDGWNVARVDASTEFLDLRHNRGDGQEPFRYLSGTGGAKDGFLAMEGSRFNPDGKAP